VASRSGFGRRRGRITGPLARDQLLELADALAAREFEPFRLCLGHRDAGELAHGRPAQLSLLQGGSEAGQHLQRFGDA
jgi:hypothetical protein